MSMAAYEKKKREGEEGAGPGREEGRGGEEEGEGLGLPLFHGLVPNFFFVDAGLVWNQTSPASFRTMHRPLTNW